MSSEPHSSARPAALCGGLAVLLNLLGVVAASALSGAYRPEAMDPWVDSLRQAPQAAVWMSVCFTLGMLTLLPLVWQLGRHSKGWAQLGAWSLGLGAIMNAAGTLAPLTVALHVLPGCEALDPCRPAARGLLGLSLSLDALFNFLLGLGLALLAWGQPGALGSARMRHFVGFAGLMTLPVAAQVQYAWAASWLGVAGPLWLIAISWLSLWILKAEAP